MQGLTLCLVLHLLHVLHLAVDELGDERDAVLLRGEGGGGVRGQLGRLGHLLTTPLPHISGGSHWTLPDFSGTKSQKSGTLCHILITTQPHAKCYLFYKT